MRTPMTTGTVAGQATEFIPTHRQNNDTPVALELTMTIPMSLEDVTAVLWWLVEDYPRAEMVAVLGDLPYLRQMILEGLACAGLDELESVRLGLDDVEPGSIAAEMLAQVRARVAELFGTPRPRRARNCEAAPRRVLAEVTA